MHTLTLTSDECSMLFDFLSAHADTFDAETDDEIEAMELAKSVLAKVRTLCVTHD
jgi:hypothetical protein